MRPDLEVDGFIIRREITFFFSDIQRYIQCHRAVGAYPTFLIALGSIGNKPRLKIKIKKGTNIEKTFEIPPSLLVMTI